MTTQVTLTVTAGALPSRTVAVLEAIKRAILSGELAQGRPLVETDLADKLGVSKTPVREALKTLAGAGLVTMSPYKGATVRVVDADQARHLYDVRLLLEPEALRRSVDNSKNAPAANPAPAAVGPVAAATHWAPARRALKTASITQDLVERNLANRDFHAALYAGCGNPLLIGMLADLSDQTALVSVAFWRRNPSWECEAAEHAAMLRAAEEGAARGAADLLRQHISSFFQRNLFQRNLPEAR
jgi:DNA-binding GntR family transcriptional regulator